MQHAHIFIGTQRTNRSEGEEQKTNNPSFHICKSDVGERLGGSANFSVGVDPNYNNGREYSFALVEAGQAAAPVLRAMLDAGGDPNGRNEEGVPIIFLNWRVSYYTDSQSRARLDLLLDRGADINSTRPEDWMVLPRLQRPALPDEHGG